jgi:RNA polymerase sigma-70 factor (ECF subfamily)
VNPDSGTDISWPPSGRPFHTTQWNMVLTARDGAPEEAHAALEALCRAYWPPLYAFVRRQGYPAPEAQDLTQEFFGRLLERNYLAHLKHTEGRFRSFLLTFLKHFLLEQRGRARAQKRGAGLTFIALDQLDEEERQWVEPVDAVTPEQLFEKRWAETVLRQALHRLQAEYAEARQLPLFERLREFQPRDPAGPSYADIGRELGLSEAAVKSAAQRFRQRHRELLREAIAQTVHRPEEIDEEIRHLREVLSGTAG